jgi:hypothetical protein
LFLQPHQTIHKEALPPATNYLTASVQSGRNLVVVQSLGGQQDHLGPLDLKIR